jgi:hypothetical protein
MIKKIKLILCLCLFYTALQGQVQLPYQVHFRDSNAKNAAKKLWDGPWDKSLRCDAVDTMRFLPTCCNSWQIVPFLGISPYIFNCTHRSTKSGGDYLALMHNYTMSGRKTTVCDSLVIMGPKVYFSNDSMPVLALLASKNNVKMEFQNCPTCGLGAMPDATIYTALEVTLVDSGDLSLGLVDTLEMTDGFTWQFIDPARFKSYTYKGWARYKMRFLGDGNLGIDEVKMYHSPKVFTTTTASCSGRDGQITIDSVNGFTAPLTYKWSTGDKQASIDSLVPGKYSVIIEDSKGQVAKREWLVGSVLQLTVDSLKSIDTAGIPGAVFLGYGGAKPMNWLWTSPLGFNSSKENPSFFQTANYRVTVKDSAGCVATMEVAMGIRCDQVVTPQTWSDTLCAGVSPTHNMLSPFPSLSARYWSTPNNTRLTEAIAPAKVWQGLLQGWNTRYVRWMDTINGCIGKAGQFSVYVRPRPASPVSKDWFDCPSNLGFNHTWAETQLNHRLYWRRLTQNTWMNHGLPQLTSSETNDPMGSFLWVGKYKDTITGCFSDTMLSSYRVKIIYEADLDGTKWYSYGTTSTLRSKGLPSGGLKNWSISYGGQFEMVGPRGSLHPCNGKKECVSSDSMLVVRHSSIPCWSPARVVSSVELLTVTGVCTSKSKLADSDTGYYSCFGTQLLAGNTVAAAVEGEKLKLGVPTTSGYHQIDDPLHMDYASCDFYLPYEWQIQYKDSTQWLPLKAVLDNAFSTQTDTNLIRLVIPKVSITLDQCKVRLRVERCEGVWSESTPQLVRIYKDTGEYVVFPNPTLDEVVIRPSTSSEIRIYNAYGLLQFKGRANETISTKTWDEGIYWVQLEKGNAVKTISKLVVLH